MNVTLQVQKTCFPIYVFASGALHKAMINVQLIENVRSAVPPRIRTSRSATSRGEPIFLSVVLCLSLAFLPYLLLCERAGGLGAVSSFLFECCAKAESKQFEDNSSLTCPKLSLMYMNLIYAILSCSSVHRQDSSKASSLQDPTKASLDSIRGRHNKQEGLNYCVLQLSTKVNQSRFWRLLRAWSRL